MQSQLDLIANTFLNGLDCFLENFPEDLQQWQFEGMCF
jgi:hypothetical protein